MKELLKQYAAYNIWATHKITDVILSLPEEKQVAELPSSFTSLYKTVLHMLDAESIWWQRLKLLERLTVPSQQFKGTLQELVAELHQQSKLWEEWIANASELSIEHVFQYQTFTKEQYKQPTWQMLLHVFNHSTYHRGQLINMLRQLGVEKLPGTDFSLWSRGQRK
ncbi:MAG: DinB family protein [Chitinophagaceae bacterium]